MPTQPGPEIRAPWERAREQLYKRVLALAEAKETSLAKIGNDLGYSRGGIPSMIKSGKGPNFRLLIELAGYLDCNSLEELMGEFGSHPYLRDGRIKPPPAP